ncbi:DUF2303 family protein [Nocardioides panaciterrulae]|uniref:Uncharacterized protein YfdQ (DUF2303 family) n=1 Tax=Nocardioides panaciterrulae TaxID=661492 RepID=A0A7Y9E2J7_9ACTN|nr:uncharacterized protein YfdQ (DUF2303 family) [Nocardioides panaciterrulae]NYD43976.1 uncharacterized protein YfdQ (DUF2303 family) [Nocardioides panaciterrulae]
MTTDNSNAQAVIDAATRATQPAELVGRFFTVVSPDGTVRLIDLEAEREKAEYAHKPRRKTGEYRVHDAESFVAYLAKHADADTEVWADAVAAKITGVLDANTTVDGPRHEEHRVIYGVLLTEAWKTWAKYDGHLPDQQVFAELIEERATDVVTPSGADMLEIAQTFKATIGVNVESSKRLSDGQRQFEYRETVDAKAGKAGRMEIPETFVLGLRPFEGADAFKVTARLRYRLADGALRIGYKLDRPEDVLREAFLSVVQKVETGITELELINSPVFLGSR